MIKERAIETIEKFPVDPDGHIIYLVYNEDMIRATESLIIEVHGEQYFNDNVFVTAFGSFLPDHLEGKRCILYFDPALNDYIGNGYN